MVETLLARLSYSTLLIQGPDDIRRMMAGDCLNVSVLLLPSLASVGDGFLRFRIHQGGVCDVPDQPQECLLPDFHLSIYSTISQTRLEWLSLPVQDVLLRPSHSSTGLH